MAPRKVIKHAGKGRKGGRIICCHQCWCSSSDSGLYLTVKAKGVFTLVDLFSWSRTKQKMIL